MSMTTEELFELAGRKVDKAYVYEINRFDVRVEIVDD